jgi:1-acyl-sn-glycerol-3-phosphate acyltransferase
MLGSMRCGARLAATLGVLLAGRAAARAAEPVLAVQARCGARIARALARAIGLELRVRGQLPPGPALLIANHRSWTDIPALAGSTACTFLAKVEVAEWPLVGAIARELGSVFVDRSCARSRRAARAALRGMLLAGRRVAVFPEGTTSRGPGLLPFQPGMFHEAAALGVPVVPIALGYASAEDAWVEDDTLLRHFAERFSQPRMQIDLWFGAPLAGRDGAALSVAASRWIERALRMQRAQAAAEGRTPEGEHGRDGLPHRLSLQAGKVAS